MPDTASISATTIQQWVAAKFDAQKIQEELKAIGCDADTIDAHVREFKRLKCAKKQMSGFICLAAGAFLGFISCLFALTNPFPELYNWFLYGLTSFAILIICLGLYQVFE